MRVKLLNCELRVASPQTASCELDFASWTFKLRVASCELRVELLNCELRVELLNCELRVEHLNKLQVVFNFRFLDRKFVNHKETFCS